jgi:hypothetical protein
MGQVPADFLWWLGWISVFVGIFIIAAGTLLLIAAIRGAFRVAKTVDAASAPDVGKLLDALSKLPQWAVAVLVGNVQILVGFWMLGATLFGYKLLPP